MSKKTLSEFISHTKNTGLIFGSHFYVEVLNGDANGETVGMFCESVNLPGLNIATTDTRIFGENRSMPYMLLYPDLNLTFLVDGEFKVVDFFQNWANMVVNRQTRTVGYQNEYANDLNIYVLDKMGDTVYKMVGKDVYPKAISDIRFDHNNKDIVKLDVSFSLKYWEVDAGYVSGTARTPAPTTWVPPYYGVDGVYPDEQPGVYGKDFKSILTSSGSEYTSVSQRAGKSLYALTATNGLSPFGQAMNNIGQYTNNMATAMNGFSQGLANIMAPVSAVATSLGGMAGLMGTLNSVTSTLGLGTPFAGAQAALVKASGTMAAVSTVRGLPGAISGVGSSVGSVGAAMGGIVPSIGTASNGSKQIMDAVKQMGSAFTKYGNSAQEAAGAVQSQINRGEY